MSGSREAPKTVTELIKELSKYDPSTRVMTNGYEGGLCDCRIPEPAKIKLNVNGLWYDGPHENVTDDQIAGADIVDAVIL